MQLFTFFKHKMSCLKELIELNIQYTQQFKKKNKLFIQRRSVFFFSIWRLLGMVRQQKNFAHAKTAVLSWHVQNFVVIGAATSEMTIFFQFGICLK